MNESNNNNNHNSFHRTEKSDSLYYPPQPIYELKRDFQITFDKERNIIRIRELENSIEHNFIESFFLGLIIFVHITIVVLMLTLQSQFNQTQYPFTYVFASNIATLMISLLGLASLKSRHLIVHEVFIFLLCAVLGNLGYMFMTTTKYSNTTISTIILGIFVSYIIILFFSFRTVAIIKKMEQLRNENENENRQPMLQA